MCLEGITGKIGGTGRLSGPVSMEQLFNELIVSVYQEEEFNFPLSD